MERSFSEISRSEINSLIDEWILNERDRKICKRRLMDGISYEGLANEFWLSPQRIRTIVTEAKNKLKTHI